MRILTLPFLEHRDIRVYPTCRGQEYAERHQFQYSLSSDEGTLEWQFDVRTLAGDVEPVHLMVLIRKVLDRCLDEGMLFPYEREPGPLPDQVENAPLSQVPDDWDILDLLLER